MGQTEFESRIMYSRFYYLAILIFTLFHPALGAPASSAFKGNTTELVLCVTKAFALLGDASKRIVSPSDDTYTDARTGEKIK